MNAQTDIFIVHFSCVFAGGEAWQVYYIHRDYLGSIVAVSNAGGAAVENRSYDAWGRLRNPSTLQPYAHDAQPALFLRRGYTGHEHLPEFGLINMNARLYDPVLGRFLSPDPFVADDTYSQDFNRYSYARNNPLMYTDPSGKEPLTWLALGIIAVYSYLKAAHANTPPGKDDGNPGNWEWNPINWIKSTPENPYPVGFVITAGFNPDGGDFYGQLSVNYGKLSVLGGFSMGDNYTSYGGGFSIDGYGASYYRTSFGGAPGPDGYANRQIVGEVGLKIRGYSARLANDFLGDGHDRWRSNAIEIGIGDFVVGTFLRNNNPAGERQEALPINHPDAVDRMGNRNLHGKSAWPNGKTYTSPGYAGLRNGSKVLQLGYSHESFQDRTQNWVHRNGFPGLGWLGVGHQNFYNDYSSFQRGGYNHSGYHNPYSLY